MTATFDFDRLLAAALEEHGPQALPDGLVDGALTRARSSAQRRPLVPGLDTRAWPRPRLVPLPLSTRTVVIAAIVMAIVAMALVGIAAYRQERSLQDLDGRLTVWAGGYAVHMVAPDGTSSRTLELRGNAQYCPHLTPSRDALIYSVRFTGLVQEAIDGSGARTLGKYNTFGYGDGIWSPDGTRLAFRAILEGSRQAFQILSPVEAFLATVETPPTDELLGEAWSADSRRLAIVRGRDGAVTIDIVDVAGVVQQSIGPISAQGIAVSWSPDGSRLATIVDPVVGWSSVSVMDLRTEASVVIPDAVGWSGTTPWSPDGSSLAVLDRSGALAIIALDRFDRVTVPVAHGLAGDVRWSPDGDAIAFIDGARLVTVQSDGTHRLERLLASGSTAWTYAWSPEGEGIAVAAWDEASRQLQLSIEDARDADSIPVATYAYADPKLGLMCLTWGESSGPK